jgi:hypothetical protein
MSDIIKLILLHPSFKHRGITYFDQFDGRWFVKESGHEGNGRRWEKDASPIHERETFVIFDQAHCRGADMKLDAKCVALVTLGPATAKENLMQGCGRLRQLGKNQQNVHFIASEEVHDQIRSRVTEKSESVTAKDVLAWAFSNSVLHCATGLPMWIMQAHHFASVKESEPHALTKDGRTLFELYQHKMIDARIPDAVNRRISSRNDSKSDLFAKINNHARHLADDDIKDPLFGFIRSVSADEECEREVELQTHPHRQNVNEREKPIAVAARENKWSFEKLWEDPKPSDVVSLTSAMSLKTIFSPKYVHIQNLANIRWDISKIWLTDNFVQTIQRESQEPLNNFLRLMDHLLVFDSGDIFALSEMESEKILQLSIDKGRLTTIELIQLCHRKMEKFHEIPRSCGLLFQGHPNGHSLKVLKQLFPAQKDCSFKDFMNLRQTIHTFFESDLEGFLYNSIQESGIDKPASPAVSSPGPSSSFSSERKTSPQTPQIANGVVSPNLNVDDRYRRKVTPKYK